MVGSSSYPTNNVGLHDFAVLDLPNLEYNDTDKTSRTSHVMLDFPILVELIEEMMLSRYHFTSDDERWSKDILSFLSCALSGSLESLMNVRDHLRL